jgi:hypothetical protein
MIIYSWFTYYKWWFFIAMLVYLMNKMKFNTWGWCVRLWKFLTRGRISNMLWRGWSGVQILPFGDGSKPYGFKCLRRWYIVPPSTQTTLSRTGWWDNLQRTPMFDGKTMVSSRFSIKLIQPIHTGIHMAYSIIFGSGEHWVAAAILMGRKGTHRVAWTTTMRDIRNTLVGLTLSCRGLLAQMV